MTRLHRERQNGKTNDDLYVYPRFLRECMLI